MMKALMSDDDCVIDTDDCHQPSSHQTQSSLLLQQVHNHQLTECLFKIQMGMMMSESLTPTTVISEAVIRLKAAPPCLLQLVHNHQLTKCLHGIGIKQ